MSTEVGRAAEDVAVSYLSERGFKIKAQNWRTRWCEVDIVVQKDGVIYFVEVKYRSTGRQGSGLDYITSAKLRQMHFAAEFWMASYPSLLDYRLAAAELTGDPPRVTQWLDDI